MANSYLTANTGTATNAKKFTLSMWIKRGSLCDTNSQRFYQGYQDGNNRFYVMFDNTNSYPDSLWIYAVTGGATQVYWYSARKFRDTNGFYHLVFSADSTQTSQGDRLKVYVNGVEETSWTKNNSPSINIDWGNQLAQSNNDLTISGTESQNQLFDGYMSHVAFVDGQALAPTEFGEIDSTSGIWKFKSPSGITWGNNGYHLKFENSANLGLDSSNNSNNFTVNGNLKQALDTPSNVYPIVNHLRRFNAGGQMSFSNAGTTITGPSSGWQMISTGTGVTTGKWYYEYKITTLGYANGFHKLGFHSDIVTDVGNNAHLAESAIDGGYAFYCQNGNLEVRTDDNIISGYGPGDLGVSFSNNDIMCLAIDMTNKKAYFRKNGDAWIKSADPVNGTNGLDISSDYTAGKYLIPAASIYYAGVGNFNFGNGYFGTTAVASAGTSSSGDDSVWEFDCPTGYYGINTKNINTYG